MSLMRDDSHLIVERVLEEGVQEYFPAEFRDLVFTFDQGEELYLKGDIPAADQFYRFAITKAIILESAYVDEVKHREDIARSEAERKAREEFELEMKRKKDRERVEAEAAAAARKAEEVKAEQAEARRRAERARYERTQALPSRHTVKRGETLPQIAAMAEVYGDSSLWPLLYRANRDQIRDPKVLWPGQQLKIPRNIDKNDINEARRFSSERQSR
ncbi:MAG TPA: LysM peptidoglycan-binding domain-containing protein [Geobacteraceae bacterium]|nr:LysM peptidoglycan-binding domain-containing protein [Geobacteraceae bacterium]